MHATTDHLVWAGPDLDALVEHVSTQTGVTPRYGGRHEGRGTHNYLLGLGRGRYLELLGPDPDQPEPDIPRPLGVDGLARPALVAWAVRTPAMADLLPAARRLGYDPGEAMPMSRRTFDGELLSWLLTPAAGGFGGVVPFVIDWLDSPHPASGLPSVELTSLTLSHPEPDAVAQALAALGVEEREIDVVRGSAPAIAVVLATPRGDVRIP